LHLHSVIVRIQQRVCKWVLFYLLVLCEQLQAKLNRVQRLAINGEAESDSRDSFHDDGTGSGAEAGVEKSEQVGPTSNMSLLDQHSKLKLEALGRLLQDLAMLSLHSCSFMHLKYNLHSHVHAVLVFIHTC